MVFDVKPLWLAIDYFTRQFVGDVNLIYPLPKLNAHTTNYIYLGRVWLGLEMEEMAKTLKMGLDA
jgi:hypothetical protein